MSDRTKIKIRKLMAMATDPATTESEREAFLAKAVEIMARAGLTADQLHERKQEKLTIRPYAVAGDGGFGEARAEVVYRVAKALGCQPLLNAPAGRTKPYTVIMVGAPSTLNVIRDVVPLILAQADTEATAAAPQGRGRAAFIRSFLDRYGITVAARISRCRRDFVEESRARGTGADLVLADEETRAAALLHQKFPNQANTRARAGDAAGARAGEAAGSRADIGHSRVGAGRRELTSA